MASRQKTKEVFIELINLQLEPHGKTYKDVVKESDWYMKYSTTREKEHLFITEATKILRTKLNSQGIKVFLNKKIVFNCISTNLFYLSYAHTFDMHIKTL